MLAHLNTAKTLSYTILFILTAFIIITLIPLSISQPSPPAISYGPNWDKSCSNGICSLTVYSYLKYYQEGGKWKEINESFQTEGCIQGYSYCQPQKNLYKTHFKDSLDNEKLVAWLKEADLLEANLALADLKDIKQWEDITSIELANIFGVNNRPDRFVEWAKENGAVEIEDLFEWKKFKEEAQKAKERGESVTNWQEWWEKNREELLEGQEKESENDSG